MAGLSRALLITIGALLLVYAVWTSVLRPYTVERVSPSFPAVPLGLKTALSSFAREVGISVPPSFSAPARIATQLDTRLLETCSDAVSELVPKLRVLEQDLFSAYTALHQLRRLGVDTVTLEARIAASIDSIERALKALNKSFESAYGCWLRVATAERLVNETENVLRNAVARLAVCRELDRALWNIRVELERLRVAALHSGNTTMLVDLKRIEHSALKAYSLCLDKPEEGRKLMKQVAEELQKVIEKWKVKT